jgi:primosomal protein N' (replication factor Y)
VVNRIRNQYLWDVLIKLPKNAELIHQCKMQIEQQAAILKFNRRYRSVGIVADVDPV